MAALEAARGATSAEFYRALLDDSSACLQAIANLERIIDDRLGADGPGMSAARTALQEVIHFIAPSAREAGVQTERAESQGRAGQAVPQVDLGGPIHDRAQALAQLRAVAQFFRCNEPHSPVAYLADKAAIWGEQPLHVWLRTVVKDHTVLAHVEELLGLNALGGSAAEGGEPTR
jgi:type VI secretion system protein ImpA